MFGIRSSYVRRNCDEGEKPFWISYSDLMTALMVLFLVVMSISLLIVTRELMNQKETYKKIIDAETARRKERNDAIKGMMLSLEEVVHKHFSGEIRISNDRHSIDFGELAHFVRKDYRLPPDGARLLRSFLPYLLSVADSKDGKKWLRRVVVEGFTDTDGSYMYNLNLSLKRAQSVICALMAAPDSSEPGLSPEQKRRVMELFLVGGFSFNSAKASKEESRRIELRLEFEGLDNDSGRRQLTPTSGLPLKIGKCQID